MIIRKNPNENADACAVKSLWRQVRRREREGATGRDVLFFNVVIQHLEQCGRLWWSLLFLLVFLLLAVLVLNEAVFLVPAHRLRELGHDEATLFGDVVLTRG